MNRDHLAALQVRLSNARMRLAAARKVRDREMLAVYVTQCEREIAGEMKFLGIEAAPEVSDDDLMRELGM